MGGGLHTEEHAADGNTRGRDDWGVESAEWRQILQQY
jgi:hypothetical protein